VSKKQLVVFGTLYNQWKETGTFRGNFYKHCAQALMIDERNPSQHISLE